MLTIAHPLTPHSLNQASVSVGTAAFANATTIAPPPCSFSVQRFGDDMSLGQSVPLHERFPANRFGPPARSPAAAPSALECACSPADRETSSQMRAIASVRALFPPPSRRFQSPAS